MSNKVYDVFLSYARADAQSVAILEQALTDAGLTIWRDVHRIEEFDAISESIVEGISRSKLFLIWYSEIYLTRPACQWELITALTALAGLKTAIQDRIIILNPHETFEHIEPVQLRDIQSQLARDITPDAATKIAQLLHDRVGRYPIPIGQAKSLPQRSWGLNISSSDEFVGRASEILRIHGYLWRDDHPISSKTYLARTVQVVGLSGTGKSFLVEEYAARFAAAYPGGIYWFNPKARSREECLSELAVALVGGELENQNTNSVEDIVAKCLGESLLDYLWIVDDLPVETTTEEFRRWKAPTSNGRTIVTTQSRRNSAMSAYIELERLSSAAANLVLQRGFPPTSDAESQAAEALCEALAYHPFVIAMASRLIARRDRATAYRSYLAEVKANSAKALERGGNLKDAYPNGYQGNIIASLMLTYQDLSPQARELMSVVTAFGSAPIPIRTLIHLICDIKKCAWCDSRRFTEEALDDLESRLFARLRGAEIRVLEIHGLIQDLFTNLIQEQANMVRARADALASVLARELAEAPNPRVHNELNLIVPHASRLSTGKSQNSFTLAAYLAQFYFLMGAYQLALARFNRAYANLDHCEPNDRFQEFVLRGYAESLIAVGRAAEAEPIYSTLLNSKRRVYGKHHPQSLAALADYLRALVADRNYEDVELYALEAVRSNKAATGAIQRRVATIRSLYAESLFGQGHFGLAEREFHWALHGLVEFTFEGNLERVRLLLKQADALARDGHIEDEELMLGAQTISLRAFQEAARLWGWSHYLSIEAGDLFAHCLELKNETEEGKILRWALCEIAEEEKRYSKKVDDLRARLALEPKPSSGAISDYIKALRESLSDPSLPSIDMIEENMSQKALEMGFDLNFVLGRSNQMVGKAKAAVKDGDAALGIDLLVETVKHLHVTQGMENTTYAMVLRELGKLLFEVGDFRWAWAVHERLCEHWIDREGERSPNAVAAVLQFVFTALAANETAIAEVTFRRYLLWILMEPEVSNPEVLNLVPFVKLASDNFTS